MGANSNQRSENQCLDFNGTIGCKLGGPVPKRKQIHRRVAGFRSEKPGAFATGFFISATGQAVRPSPEVVRGGGGVAGGGGGVVGGGVVGGVVVGGVVPSLPVG